MALPCSGAFPCSGICGLVLFLFKEMDQARLSEFTIQIRVFAFKASTAKRQLMLLAHIGDTIIRRLVTAGHTVVSLLGFGR